MGWEDNDYVRSLKDLIKALKKSDILLFFLS